MNKVIPKVRGVVKRVCVFSERKGGYAIGGKFIRHQVNLKPFSPKSSEAGKKRRGKIKNGHKTALDNK